MAIKILYYTDQIYLHGGLERVLANKVNYLSSHTDYELHILTFQQEGKEPCYYLPKSVKLHDINIKYNRKISFLHPANILKAPKHYSKLKQILELINPDVIIVCNYEFGFYFMPKLVGRAILIKEYHSSNYFGFVERQNNKAFLKNIKYKITDYFESKYDVLALLSKDELPYYTSKNKIVIPNAITKFSDAASKSDKKRVIAAGRIAPVKGFEKLIAAWKFVNNEYQNDWQLDIFGNGDPNYINALNKQIIELGLQNCVSIKQATNNLESEMLNASIYAMSSLTECFPMVLLEAMSCGLPIVSFDCPNGPRNIITQNNDGILVEYLNEEKLGTALLELIKNDNKRLEMGRNARLNVKKFSQENIMALWLKIFNSK